MKTFFRFALSVALLSSTAVVALAEGLETVWTGAGGDSAWGNAANWSAGVPTTDGIASFAGRTDAAAIDLGDDSVSVAGIVCGTGALTFSGSGTLTLAGATPLSGAGAVTASFSCPVVFSADEASIDLNGGALTFGGATTLSTLHVAGGCVICSGDGTISGALLNLISFTDLSKDASTSGLTIDNAETAKSGRLADLAKLRIKGPAHLNVVGGTETLVVESLADVVFGEWKTAVALSGKLDLTFVKADAEPSGFIALSIGSEARLLSEEANVHGVWKPWVECTRTSNIPYFWTRGDDKVISRLTTYSTLATGENTNTDAAYSFNGDVTASGEIGALRTTNGGTLTIGDNDLVIKSGLIPVASDYRNFEVKSSGDGVLVFGGNDIFTEHGNSQVNFSAPVEWIRPEGNTAPGPSLFMFGNHWTWFAWSGEDRIGDYNMLYFPNQENQRIEFDGPSERTFHGPIVGGDKVEIQKKGSGILRFLGPRYGGWSPIKVEQGTLVLGHAQMNINYITLNTDAEVRLENGVTLNCSINNWETDDANNTISGIGRFWFPKRSGGGYWHFVNRGNWVSPGLPHQIGVLQISGDRVDGTDFQFRIRSGAHFRIKVDAETSDKVQLDQWWQYVKFNYDTNPTINLEVNAFQEGEKISQMTEYMFFEVLHTPRSRITGGGDVTWKITTATPKLLDVSQAKVVYKELPNINNDGNNGHTAFYVTGVKTICHGFRVFLR